MRKLTAVVWEDMYESAGMLLGQLLEMDIQVEAEDEEGIRKELLELIKWIEDLGDFETGKKSPRKYWNMKKRAKQVEGVRTDNTEMEIWRVM